MPKGRGLYTRKGANGRRMYFRDGKLISEKSFKASKRARKSSPRRTNRKNTPAKRGNPKRRNNNMARYRKPGMPHPSVTGMASGLAIADYLNRKATGTTTVIKTLTDGNLSGALNRLTANTKDLVGTTGGKTTLVTSMVLAVGGGLARRYFPNVKLGGSKFYFRI